MIVQIPSISPLVLQMLPFEVFIIHLSSVSREGTCSVPLNYQSLFSPATTRQEAKNMGDPEKGVGGVRKKRRRWRRGAGGGWGADRTRESKKKGGIA